MLRVFVLMSGSPFAGFLAGTRIPGRDYHDDGWLFCWDNGKPPHPDTITRRFKKLAKAADLPEIDLHDVRHSYATAVATRKSTGRRYPSASATRTLPSP